MPSAHLLCLLAVVVCVGLASYGAQERSDYARRSRRSRRRDDVVAVVPDAADGDPLLSEAARLEHGGYDGHAADMVLTVGAKLAEQALGVLEREVAEAVPPAVQATLADAAVFVSQARHLWWVEEVDRRERQARAGRADGAPQ